MHLTEVLTGSESETFNKLPENERLVVGSVIRDFGELVNTLNDGKLSSGRLKTVRSLMRGEGLRLAKESNGIQFICSVAVRLFPELMNET
jgi:hypothetical protein